MPVSRSPSDLLTEGQRRHLSATLEHVQIALREIEVFATTRASPTPALLAHVASDLPPGFDDAIQKPLEQARLLVAEIAETLGLRPYRSSARRTVQSLVLSSLVTLEDAFSRTLGGYGEVHPDLPSVLDPALQRLHHEITSVGATLHILTRTNEVEEPTG